jgi:CRP-like cAMP-binding protein
VYVRPQPVGCKHSAVATRSFRKATTRTPSRRVVEGRVKIYKRLVSGRDLILKIFGAGAPLGAVAVYEGRPYPASAQAIEPTLCLLLPRQAFFNLLEQSPLIVRGVLSGLSQRLSELTERLTELAGAGVEARFARLFLRLAGQFGEPGPRGTSCVCLCHVKSWPT